MSVSCKASCLVIGNTNNVIGILNFEQTENGVQITGTLSLPDGKHGIQICEYGNLSGDNFANCGSIFNPFGKTHGAPTDDNRMVGDLGNVTAENNKCTVKLTDTCISLVGPHSIIGRSLVVYAGEDDMGRGGHDNSNTTGNPGPRIGAGVIGIAK